MLPIVSTFALAHRPILQVRREINSDDNHSNWWLNGRECRMKASAGCCCAQLVWSIAELSPPLQKGAASH